MTPRKKTPAKRTPAKKAAPKKSASPARGQTPPARTAPKKTPAKKPPAKRTATKKTAPPKTTKRTPSPRAARKKSQPLPPNVDEVIGNLGAGQTGAGREAPAPVQPDAPVPGAIENACSTELKELGLDGTALGASAIALARMADQSTGAASVAVALREMRMTLAAARALGRPASARPGVDGPNGEGEGGVVPETRLEKLRREREQGRGSR